MRTEKEYFRRSFFYLFILSFASSQITPGQTFKFDSGNSNRDSHAMEVLDALTFPTVSFQSKEIKTSGQDLLVSGDLTFHGVTKPISFDATTVSSGSDLTVQGKANISLTSYQIERPSLLFIPVEDTLRITFTLSFQINKQDLK
jgi:polyisoprenoid-binding protein YceI